MAAGAGSDHQNGEMHEINVTPFIDVMLVLLIIFMVAAPLATVDINVDLPTTNKEAQPRPESPIFLTIKSDHTLALGDEIVDEGQLIGALDSLTQTDKEQRIYLRADKRIDYENLMKVISQLRAAGYLQVALVGLEGSAGG